MVRVRAVVLVSLLTLVACKKAELGTPVPDGVTVSVDKTSVSADDGSVTVTAMVFEEGVPLLDYPITFEITGGIASPAVVVSTDPTTAIATHTFSNLRMATSPGAPGVVSVRAGEVPNEVTATKSIQILPGVATAITVSPADQDVSADVGSLGVSIGATDAWSNAVPDAPVMLSSNAPGSTIEGGTMHNLRTAGSWFVYGTLAGSTAVTDSAGFVVLAGAPAQLQSSVNRPVVGQQESIKIYCARMDGYGNDLTSGATFSVSTSPASTVAAIAGTAGAFQASSFATAGVYTASCSSGALFDQTGFHVAAQAAGPSVLATLDKSVVEAGMTATLTCREYDAYGNPTATTFDPGMGEVSSTGGTVTGGAGNTFTITGLTTKGTFAATCSKSGSGSDSDDFAVVDTTAPVISSFTVTAGGPDHNGGIADNRFGIETITYTLVATDTVGIAKEEIAVITAGADAGAASLNPILENGETSRTRTFALGIGAANTTFAPITVRAQVTDTTGNVRTMDHTFTFDPGASIPAPVGVTIRTHFETTGQDAIAIATSGGTLYAKRYEPEMLDVDDVIRIPGEGTAFTVEASDFLPGQKDDSLFGLAHADGGFGGRTLFHTLVGGTGNIGAFASGSPLIHSTAPMIPSDVCFRGGASPSLFIIELGGAAEQVVAIDAAGNGTVLYDDLIDDVLDLPLAIHAIGNDLLVADPTGDLFRFDGTLGTRTLFGNVAANNAYDLVVGSKVLVAGGVTGTVYRLTTAGATEAPVSSSFDFPFALAIGSTGTLYVADAVGGTHTRIYRVTGY